MAKFGISGVGPCSPFSYVQSLAGQGYSQDGTGPNAPDANADLWSAAMTGNQPVIGDNPALCGLNTALAGGEAGENPEPSLTYAGCAYDWIETQCTGNQTWPTTDGSGGIWGCPVLTGGQTTLAGCATIPASSCAPPTTCIPVPTVVVPSATIELPISCQFNFLPPAGYTPNEDLSDDPVGSAPTTTNPSGNNAGDDRTGEGDGMACIVQAQTNDSTAANPTADPQWEPLGQPLTLIPEGTNNTENGRYGDLTVPLPSANAQIRLQYTSFVLQDGTVDGSGVTDVAPGQVEPQPIGSLYCSRAESYGSPASQGYKYCENDSGPAVGFSPPVNVAIEPDAELQLAAVPINIIYQAPTGYDTSSFQSEASSTTQVTESLDNEGTDTQGESNAFGFGAGVSIGIPELFKVNLNYQGTWTKGTSNTTVNSSTKGQSVQVTYTLSQTFGSGANPRLYGKEKGLRPLAPGSPGANNGHAPWYYDRIVLEVGSHVATFDLNACADGAPTNTGSYYDEKTETVATDVPTCAGGVTPLAGYLPYDSGIGTMGLAIYQLIPCLAAKNGCTFSGPGGSPVVIFARSGRGSHKRGPLCRHRAGDPRDPATGWYTCRPECGPRNGTGRTRPHPQWGTSMIPTLV